MAKQKAKKRHIANSDTDSENSYPVSQPTNSSSSSPSSSNKKPYVPRFLIIHSEKEGETISSLSPFVVHKTIMSIAGEPKSIKKVDVYIPNPLRCYHCQVFGHHENKCGRHAVCCNCGEPEHCAPSGVCDKPAKCVNCSGNHPANSKQCPQWEKEKKILKIKCENNLSFPDARKQYEQFYTGQTYASAVKPGTCNKSTQTDNKSTQTDDSFTEYLKQTTEKTQGTKEKRNTSPKPGKVTLLILGQPLRWRP